jgi:hypothetical protein
MKKRRRRYEALQIKSKVRKMVSLVYSNGREMSNNVASVVETGGKRKPGGLEKDGSGKSGSQDNRGNSHRVRDGPNTGKLTGRWNTLPAIPLLLSREVLRYSFSCNIVLYFILRAMLIMIDRVGSVFLAQSGEKSRGCQRSCRHADLVHSTCYSRRHSELYHTQSAVDTNKSIEV